MLYDTQKQSSLVVFVFQMIDRICVKVQDHLNSLRNSETDVILEDVRSAESLIKDARNSKTVRRQLKGQGFFIITKGAICCTVSRKHTNIKQ